MLRRIALDALVESLVDDGLDILVASLDNHHLHVLGRFTDLRPRRKIGWAKLAATQALKYYLGTLNDPFLKLEPGKGIWAKRFKAEPIKNRPHLVKALNYIAGHEKRGSIIYLDPSLRDKRNREKKI
jgi:hypothetical protein